MASKRKKKEETVKEVAPPTADEKTAVKEAVVKETAVKETGAANATDETTKADETAKADTAPTADEKTAVDEAVVKETAVDEVKTEVNADDTAKADETAKKSSTKKPKKEAAPAVEPAKPQVERGALVKVKLTGAETALVAGRSVLRNEVHTVTYGAFRLANHANPGIFSVRYPDAQEFVTET